MEYKIYSENDEYTFEKIGDLLNFIKSNSEKIYYKVINNEKIKIKTEEVAILKAKGIDTYKNELEIINLKKQLKLLFRQLVLLMGQNIVYFIILIKKDRLSVLILSEFIKLLRKNF